MNEPVVVFATSSDIEASIVIALLDSHGIQGFRSSGNANAILPMAVNPLGGQIRVVVPEGEADEALRIIASHREDVGARVVRLRDDGFAIEFTRLQHPDFLEENVSGS